MTTSNKSEILPEMIVLKDMTFFNKNLFIKSKISSDYLFQKDAQL